MSVIQLSAEEAEALAQLLQDSLASLDLELLHTERREFREGLTHRRDIVRDLLARLPQTDPGSPEAAINPLLASPAAPPSRTAPRTRAPS